VAITARQTVAQRVFAGPWSRHVFAPDLTQHLRPEFGNVLRADPDRPEVEEERRVHDMEQDRRGQQDAGHPVPLHPREPDAHDGQERGEEQHQHGDRHHPVEHARHEPVAQNPRGQAGTFGLQPIDFIGVALAVLREQHVATVREQEQQTANQRGPEQVPRNVDEDRFAPRAAHPF
jgi:hypothetical protein